RTPTCRPCSTTTTPGRCCTSRTAARSTRWAASSRRCSWRARPSTRSCWRVTSRATWSRSSRTPGRAASPRGRPPGSRPRPRRRTQPMAWTLDPDRCFSPVPSVRARARELYEGVRGLPLVSPHGHVPPELLADESARFSDPASLFIVPDHYVFRMLYSQGVPLESLGVPTLDGTPVEKDPRQIWRTFCAHFHLFDGTPTGLWLKSELIELFGLDV